jgi:hypothetical protein
MACGIPAAEFLGICIIMSDYDLNMNMLEVVKRIDEFEKTTGMDYGTGQQDFHCAFIDLFLRMAKEYDHNFELDDFLGKTTLKDWVGPILRFQDVWFNDEGESWNDVPEDGNWPDDKKGLVSWKDTDGNLHGRIVRDHLGDRFAIKASLRFDRRLRELFKNGYPGRHELIKFFHRGLYARCIPFYWSRRGL